MAPHFFTETPAVNRHYEISTTRQETLPHHRPHTVSRGDHRPEGPDRIRFEEIDRALARHELIKIKIFAADRDARKALTDEVCSTVNAEMIQSIGNVVVLFRAAPKPNPKLSNLLRFQAK